MKRLESDALDGCNVDGALLCLEIRCGLTRLSFSGCSFITFYRPYSTKVVLAVIWSGLTPREVFGVIGCVSLAADV